MISYFFSCLTDTIESVRTPEPCREVTSHRSPSTIVEMVSPNENVPSTNFVPEPTSHDPDYRSVLEAETGYIAYESYLDTCIPRIPDHYGVAESLREQRRKEAAKPVDRTTVPDGRCVILDVSKSRGLVDKIEARLELSCEKSIRMLDSGWQNPRNRNAAAIALLRALRLPLAENCSRIILWYMVNAKLDLEWIDILGLVLKIPPSYFQILLRKQYGQGYSYKGREPDLLDPDLLDPDHLMIGNVTATILDGRDSNFSHNEPIILMAGSSVDFQYDPDINTHLERELRHESPSAIRNNYLLGWRHEHHRHYVQLLHRLLNQKCESDRSVTDLFYTSLLPILRFQVSILQHHYRRARVAFSELKATDENTDALDEKRFDLRRAIEEFENGLQVFRSHVIINYDEKWLDGPEYRAVQEQWKCVVAMARRLETEIRDQMQLMVANLSISESRKSIELSTVQIQEGKQGTSQPIEKILWQGY